MSPETKAAFEHELHYLQAGIEQMESYLLSTAVYRSVGINALSGEPPYPELTLGNLLLSRLRAEALAQTPAQQAELYKSYEEMEAQHARWRVAWVKKAAAEFRARMALWTTFLEDYRLNPEAQYDRYAYEVGRRVLLELLLKEAPNIAETQGELLEKLDHMLKSILVEGDFIWDSSLEKSFPKAEFWYLYGKLPKAISGAKDTYYD